MMRCRLTKSQNFFTETNKKSAAVDVTHSGDDSPGRLFISIPSFHPKDDNNHHHESHESTPPHHLLIRTRKSPNLIICLLFHSFIRIFQDENPSLSSF